MGRTQNTQENNPTSIDDRDVNQFTDSFNTSTEFDVTDDSDNSIELGDNNIITEGDVIVERLDGEVVERAFNFGNQAIESNERVIGEALRTSESVVTDALRVNERVVTGALNTTTNAIRELNEDNLESFQLLTTTIGENAEEQKEFALRVAELQIEAGQENLESAFQSTVGGLAELQSENTKIIVGVVMTGLVAIAIFRKN
ncbi:hypothetical protein [Kordiimonas sp. SCSIO 12610]|uniref:hypothetical protein n=1 Tax=Kordiimonas sp. SCSIO 12610 TaxID=2829597 RepID=UPI00210DC858|nr:hypothetical protein [Kordiimonas sp. SCSIO 12610]UTW53965.1 hypothetical protein KFF44_08935 [Kordiimonas sp. SCSIO 12610]